jgi:hypothetical protein
LSSDLGFTFKDKSGEIQIFHHGRKATTLRGLKAVEFREEVAYTDFSAQQQIMARLTGNYKRGNEREAKNHPKNRRF